MRTGWDVGLEVTAWLGKRCVGPYRKAYAKDLAALKSYLEGEPDTR